MSFHQLLFVEPKYKTEDFIDDSFDINEFYRYCRYPNCGRNPKYEGWCHSHRRQNR